MTPPRIVALGEVLWDLLPTGRMLGGAPANFAFHAHGLGADARLISRVGDDALGREIRERLAAAGMAMDGLQVDAAAPTGTVSVELSADGQPKYVIHEQVAWDAIEASESARAIVAQTDAVCFGSLAQRSAASRASIRALVAAAPAEALKIFDVNLRQDFYDRETVEASLEMANVLKLNETELPILAEMFGVTGETREQVAALAARFGLRAVALTLGARGSLLLVDGVIDVRPGNPVEIQDTIGAGDAFTAALCCGLLAGWGPGRINQHASAVAGYVCTQRGGMPVLPAGVRLG